MTHDVQNLYPISCIFNVSMGVRQRSASETQDIHLLLYGGYLTMEFMWRAQRKSKYGFILTVNSVHCHLSL